MTDPVLPPARRQRIESVDILRGVIMILMALDHTRDYFGMPGNPTDPATTTIAPFFTRWVTHFCAPVFFLLTGTGAFLSLRRKSPAELSRFLFTRGLWLILLELLFTRTLGWTFNLDFHVMVLVVLWALGWSMIVLAALVRLPTWAVTTFGATLIVAHNLFDGVKAASLGAFAPLWGILHVQSLIVNTRSLVVFVAYPLIPWIGVTAVGYGLGQLYSWPADRRQALLLRLGFAFSLAFLALRLVNVYGDPSRWSARKSVAFTLLSFLNTTKYPPSLLFLLMTLGPALLALRALDGRTPKVLRPALVFGQVPLFYYVVHIPLIHGIAVIVCYLRYGTAHWMFETPDLGHFPFSQPPGWGYPLPIVYLVWAGVVVLLYPLCHWYAALKRRGGDRWLSYL